MEKFRLYIRGLITQTLWCNVAEAVVCYLNPFLLNSGKALVPTASGKVYWLRLAHNQVPPQKLFSAEKLLPCSKLNILLRDSLYPKLVRNGLKRLGLLIYGAKFRTILN